MKHKLFYAFALSLFFASEASAQVSVQAGKLAGDRQIDFYRAELAYSPNPEKYRDVTGTPYLFEKWALGSAKTANKASREDVQLKYDEIDDIVVVKGDDDKMLTFSSPVFEFVIKDPKTEMVRKFRSGFTATKSNSETSFFEVLEDGKIKLLRKNHKVISESKEYSGAVKRSVSDAIKYYLVNADNTPVALKLDIKSIGALLPEKQTQLSEYAKTNKLNLKNQEDVVKLISYYNSL